MSNKNNDIIENNPENLKSGMFHYSKPERITLSDYEESGAGFNAKSYNHVNGKTMIKLYEPYIPYTDIERELHASLAISEIGLHIPQAYRLITDGERFGVEFERISPKRSFARAISQEPQNLEKYAVAFAHACKTLHETPCNTTVFNPADAYFKSAVMASKYFTESEKSKMLCFIDFIPNKLTCLHGDMHIGNLITNEKEIYWIDVADFRYGNPLYDIGMFYLVSNCNSEEMTQELYHISNAQMQEIWKIFVCEYFGVNADIQEINAQCAPIAALYMIVYGSKGTMRKEMMEYITKTLLS